MRKNNFSLFLFALFGIVLFSGLISATITIISPANYSNYSGSSLVSFNVSYVNGTDYNDAKNATFYYNLSGVWTYIGFTTDCNNAALIGSCNASLNISGLTDGKYSINATVGNITTEGASVLTSNIIFDKTPPAVSFSGITNTINNGNYSGIITLNVSASDAVIGVNSVYFNITNSSGVQNAFSPALISSSSYYNLSLNTSTLTDGLYNLTVYANDSLNNLNKTSYIQILIDNTAPTATFSCSPNSTNAAGTVTCTCTPSDTGAGINISATTYTTGNPSLVDVGTFTLPCSFADLAGNTGNKTTTYTVVALGSAATTSSSGSTTTTSTPQNVSAQSLNTITNQSSVIVSNFNVDLVKQIQIEVSQTETNVKLDVVKYDSKPAEVLVEKNNSYAYLHIDAQNLTYLSKAIMTIQVNKTWVLDRGLSKNDIALFRYDELTNVWNALSTTFSSEDNNNYYYTIELNHFSYFAIASNKSEVSTNIPSPEKTFLGLPYWAWVVIVIVLIIIGVGFSLRKKLKRK